MSGYKRILLAVDLADESSIAGQRAIELARLFDAELHVVHVVEPLSLAVRVGPGAHRGAD